MNIRNLIFLGSIIAQTIGGIFIIVFDEAYWGGYMMGLGSGFALMLLLISLMEKHYIQKFKGLE